NEKCDEAKHSDTNWHAYCDTNTNHNISNYSITKSDNKMDRTIQILRRSWILLIPLGALLLYMYGFKVRLNFPIKDMFYVLAIPSVIGLVMLSSYVKKYAVTESLGSITLELYAVQMIFGQQILIWAYNVFNKNALLTNIFVTGVMLLLAYIISYVIKRGERLIIK
ncbi:MAG: hypothetical protein MSE26_04575, partial [Lachnospiraceae bacterium]|nr:hypothetical protein [Lachnospiraceae bacterium]